MATVVWMLRSSHAYSSWSVVWKMWLANRIRPGHTCKTSSYSYRHHSQAPTMERFSGEFQTLPAVGEMLLKQGSHQFTHHHSIVEGGCGLTLTWPFGLVAMVIGLPLIIPISCYTCPLFSVLSGHWIAGVAIKCVSVLI